MATETEEIASVTSAYRIRTVTQSRCDVGLDALRFGQSLAGCSKTVVVLGAPRSGTSMVAGVLRLMGIFMGSDLDDKHEDREFAFATDSNGKPVSIYQSLSRLFRLKKVINSRNKDYAFWGWKEPLSIMLLGIIAPFLRNPHYIVIMRNPVSCALSAEHHAGRPAQRATGKTLDKCRQIMHFISRKNRPVLMVSYESAIKHPRQFCQALVEFLDVSIPQEQLSAAEKFIDPERGYQEIITDPRIGYLERFEGAVLEGWAIDFERTAPVNLRILAGNRVIAETCADLPRADVADTYGQNYLKSGFCIRLDSVALPNSAVRVVYADTGRDLRNSPMKIV